VAGSAGGFLALEQRSVAAARNFSRSADPACFCPACLVCSTAAASAGDASCGSGAPSGDGAGGVSLFSQYLLAVVQPTTVGPRSFPRRAFASREDHTAAGEACRV